MVFTDDSLSIGNHFRTLKVHRVERWHGQHYRTANTSNSVRGGMQALQSGIVR